MESANCSKLLRASAWTLTRQRILYPQSLRIAHFSTSRSTRQADVKVFHEVPELRQYRQNIRNDKRTVGLVPTMGALHRGHLTLAREAAKENSEVFVSIYVNPTQFGVNEDLDKYPKTWDSDMAQIKDLNKELEKEGQQGRVTAVFAPTTKTMYPTLPPTSEPAGFGSFVTLTPLGLLLEGRSRPVFFRGVATICTKLFNIVQPEAVYFGQKDAQQSVVIRRMVTDFHINTNVRVLPTEREEDGLAMSSRNVYLGKRRRMAAKLIPTALRAAEEVYTQGVFDREKILDAFLLSVGGAQKLMLHFDYPKGVRFELDYVSLADPDSMEDVAAVDPKKGAILSTAMKMLPLESDDPEEDCPGQGKITVRLIDNIVLPPKA